MKTVYFVQTNGNGHAASSDPKFIALLRSFPFMREVGREEYEARL